MAVNYEKRVMALEADVKSLTECCHRLVDRLDALVQAGLKIPTKEPDMHGSFGWSRFDEY